MLDYLTALGPTACGHIRDLVLVDTGICYANPYRLRGAKEWRGVAKEAFPRLTSQPRTRTLRSDAVRCDMSYLRPRHALSVITASDLGAGYTAVVRQEMEIGREKDGSGLRAPLRMDVIATTWVEVE